MIIPKHKLYFYAMRHFPWKKSAILYLKMATKRNLRKKKRTPGENEIRMELFLCLIYTIFLYKNWNIHSDFAFKFEYKNILIFFVHFFISTVWIPQLFVLNKMKCKICALDIGICNLVNEQKKRSAILNGARKQDGCRAYGLLANNAFIYSLCYYRIE